MHPRDSALRQGLRLDSLVLLHRTPRHSGYSGEGQRVAEVADVTRQKEPSCRKVGFGTSPPLSRPVAIPKDGFGEQAPCIHSKGCCVFSRKRCGEFRAATVVHVQAKHVESLPA